MASGLAEELRFGFGENWADYVEQHFSEEKIEQSLAHLLDFLKRSDLRGLSFLDIGCGSGLHSLAAHKSGADPIFSFDYDENSVATTRKLCETVGRPESWVVEQGSVLDEAYMGQLPKADLVYSWGVLHHTGDMWKAVRNALIPVKPGGLFYIALYASEMYVDPPASHWIKIKKQYNQASNLKKRQMEWGYALHHTIIPELRSLRNPLKAMNAYRPRGMTYWTDVRDWLGGWPMEFAGLWETAEYVKRERGLDLVNVNTGEACTEFLFCDLEQSEDWRKIVAERELTPLEGPFKRGTGQSWVAELSELADQSDSSQTPQRSRLMLYEDGVPLGFWHALHDHIRVAGGGRFSHWGGRMLFSTTDNSDPNSNGRTYAYCTDY